MNRFVITAALALLAASPALAQTTAPTTPAPTVAQRDIAVEHRIASLRASLKVTPAEETPFNDFAQVMRDNAREMTAMVQKQRLAAATETAIDQMHAYATIAEAHATETNRLVTAFTALYGALTADQKKSADASFRQFAASMRS